MDIKSPSPVGTYLSTACAVHCAVEPIVLPLLPLAGVTLPMNHVLELWLIGGSVSWALWNFSRGYSVHGRSALFALLASALALIGTGVLAGHFDNIHAVWEAGLVAAGSIILAVGQYWNRRLHRHCAQCSHPQAPCASDRWTA